MTAIENAYEKLESIILYFLPDEAQWHKQRFSTIKELPSKLRVSHSLHSLGFLPSSTHRRDAAIALRRFRQRQSPCHQPSVRSLTCHFSFAHPLTRSIFAVSHLNPPSARASPTFSAAVWTR